MLQQCLNALIKAQVPTTIWFLSLMSPLRKSTKIRKKKVLSLIPMIPLNDMVTIWCAAVIQESGSVLVSFLNFFWLPTWPWKKPSFLSLLSFFFFFKQRNCWYSYRKWHSYDEIFTEKHSQKAKDARLNCLFKTIWL